MNRKKKIASIAVNYRQKMAADLFKSRDHNLCNGNDGVMT